MKLPFGSNVPLAARPGLTRDEALRELRTAMTLLVGHDERQSIECEHVKSVKVEALEVAS